MAVVLQLQTPAQSVGEHYVVVWEKGVFAPAKKKNMGVDYE